MTKRNVRLRNKEGVILYPETKFKYLLDVEVTSSDVNQLLNIRDNIQDQIDGLSDSISQEITDRENVDTELQNSIGSVSDNLTTHTSNTSNPHSVTKEQVGLGNVDNTSDVNKPISTATQSALDNKVDKVSGKGLSTNDFTNDLKTKLDNIEAGAEVNTVNSVNNKTGVVVLDYSDVGALANTTTINDLTSEAQQNALNSGATSSNIGQISTNQNNISNIQELIPSQATSSNQLADKGFVNSTVQTATANFRGNWDDWSDVPTDTSLYPQDEEGSTVPTKNDYIIIVDASDYNLETLEGTWRFKYSGLWTTNGKNGWHPEYQINETPLTEAQLNALNSGITSSLVSQISTNTGNITELQGNKYGKTVEFASNTLTLKDQDGNSLSTTSINIPSVGDGTITITQGGTTKGTFTTNQSGNSTIELDATSGGTYTAGTGIDITSNEISIIQNPASITPVGNLINNNGVLSNFSTENCALLEPNRKFSDYTENANTWEMVWKFTFAEPDATYNNTQVLYAQGAGYPSRFYTKDYKISIYLNNGASDETQVVAKTGTTTLVVGNTYYYKAEFTGTVYNIYLSTDGINWNLEGSVTTSRKMTPRGANWAIGKRYDVNNAYSFPFQGSIDVNESYIKIDGEYWWRGATESGAGVVAKATNNLYGLVKPDGTSITVNDGVISGFSGDYANLTNKPNLSTVALTGSYNDLTNKPTLFSGNYNDLTNKPNLSTVATSGSYNDLSNKPTIGNATITFTQGGTTKGSITLNQTSNQTIAFDAGGGGGGSTYTAGEGLYLSDNEFSILQEDIGTEPDEVNIEGSPYTADGKVYSNFSTSSYLTPPETLTLASTDDFEFQVKVMNTSSSTTGMIGYIWYARNTSYFGMFIRDGLEAWILGDTSYGGITLNDADVRTPNVWRWYKLKKTGSTITLSYSTDGETWISNSLQMTFSGFSSKTISYGSADNTSGNVFQGKIDLNETYIKKNGNFWWKPYSELEPKEVAKATDTLYGLVKPDNETITVDNGILTALSGLPYTGGNGIKVENNEVSIVQDGTIRVVTDYTNIGDIEVSYNGIASGFSDSKYLIITSLSWLITGTTLYLKFKTPSTSFTSEKQIFSTNNMNLCISNSYGLFSWDFNSSTARTLVSYANLQWNADYWVKAEIGSSTVSYSYSTDGTTWSSPVNSNSKPSSSNTAYLGRSQDSTGRAFTGSIDLSECYAKANDDYVWRAFYTVGGGTVTYNVNRVGFPTLQNGIGSDFTANDYFTLPEPFSPSNKTWEIVMKFTTDANLSGNQGIFTGLGSSDGCTPLYLNGNKLVTYLSSNGTDWNLMSSQILTLSTNTTYKIKEEFTGSQYIWYLYENGDWTTIYTLTSSTKVYGGLNMQIGTNRGTGGAFKGTVDLNEWYIKINNELWWEGATVAPTGNVAVATENLFGLVKPDNETIIVNDGVISANVIPDQTGNSGKYLRTVNNELVWYTVEGGGGSSLPDMVGQSGKFLTNDGTDARWDDTTFILRSWERTDEFTYNNVNYKRLNYIQVPDNLTSYTTNYRLAYTPINYISSTDSYEIDFQFLINPNYDGSQSRMSFFIWGMGSGSWSKSNNIYFGIVPPTTTTEKYALSIYNSSGTSYVEYDFVEGENYKIRFDQNSIYVNDVRVLYKPYYNFTASAGSYYSFQLWYYYSYNTYPLPFRLKSLKHKRNGILIESSKPVMNMTAGTVGMWDDIRNTYYTSEGASSGYRYWYG